MTYDVQRWTPIPGALEELMAASDSGRYVLASDAEAHEEAAVEQAIENCIMVLQSHDIQDCAKSGEGVIVKITLGAGTGAVYINRDKTIAALRSLLEGEQK